MAIINEPTPFRSVPEGRFAGRIGSCRVADDQGPLAILRKSEVHSVDDPPFNVVTDCSQLKQQVLEMAAVGDREDGSDVFQYEHGWSQTVEYADQRREGVGTLVGDPFLLSGEAERLTRKPSGQDVVSRYFPDQIEEVALVEARRAERRFIDGRSVGVPVVGPDRLQADVVGSDPETADAA